MLVFQQLITPDCSSNLTGNPVADNEDDDCKIINAKTVFDHIRQKAKSLPILPVSNDTTSPSLEAFSLIKKRTREMHLELDNDPDVTEIQVSYRTPQSRRAFQHPQHAETELEIQIIDEDDHTHITHSPTTSHLMRDAGICYKPYCMNFNFTSISSYTHST